MLQGTHTVTLISFRTGPMSTKAKLTLASSVAFCIASVTGVHYIQNSEKEVSSNTTKMRNSFFYRI